MKRVLFIIAALFGVNFVFAQKFSKNAVIQVLGTSQYDVKAIGKAIEITIFEDPAKCDPVKGNLTLVEQKGYFSRALAEKNIAFSKFVEIEQTLQFRYKHQNFKYTSLKLEELETIRKIAIQQGINVKETYFVMPEHRFDEEDQHAIMALKDAMKKAKTIAAKFGSKKLKLISIDDDTSEAGLEDLLEKYEDNENYDQMRELIDLFSEMDINQSPKNLRESTKSSYTILVTFRVE